MSAKYWTKFRILQNIVISKEFWKIPLGNKEKICVLWVFAGCRISQYFEIKCLENGGIQIDEGTKQIFYYKKGKLQIKYILVTKSNTWFTAKLADYIRESALFLLKLQVPYQVYIISSKYMVYLLLITEKKNSNKVLDIEPVRDPTCTNWWFPNNFLKANIRGWDFSASKSPKPL